ncbi:hypothetical protein GC173_15970 [bacterium]|nr:hypothetical protein [bacterium]
MKRMTTTSRAASALLLGALLAVGSQARAGNGLVITEDPNTRKVTGYANANAPADQPAAWTVATSADLTESGIPPGAYKNVWGIFLGVSDYKNYTDLANPVNDARVLSDTMVKVSGLKDPIVLLNGQVTEQNIQNALASLASKVGPGDLVVFHYSGHGVALKSTSGDSRPRGYMLMQDAAPPKEAFATKSSLYGFVDMTRLEKMLEIAGVRPKHTIYILDCCFGGFGAEFESQAVATRSIFGGTQVKDYTASANAMLGKRSTLFLSAGDASQEVLDISVDYQGYGLLTGFIIQSLQDPFAMGVRPIGAGDITYLPALELANASKLEIPQRASNTLQAILNQLSEEARVTAPNLEQLSAFSDADFGKLPPKLARDYREIQKLYRNTQNPQYMKKNQGAPLIPLRSIATPTPTPVPTPTARPTPTPVNVTPTPRPTPTLAPSPTPLPPTPTMRPTPPPVTPSPTPRVTPRVTPEPTMTPTPAPPVGTVPFYITYAKDVGRHYSDQTYGDRLEKVFTLLYTGTPPKPSKSSNDLVRIAADVFARPEISNDTWKQIYTRESYTIDQTLTGWQRNEIAFREKWRSKYNLQFTAIPYTGYQLSENYVLKFRLANYDTDPLYYYLLGFDEAGILQWVAPKDFDGKEVNKAWKDSVGNYASGEAPLLVSKVYAFPGDDTTTGAPGFVPIEGSNDQWLFLVVSETRWPELERALDEACTTSFKHYNDSRPDAPKNFKVKSQAKLELRVRAVGRPTTESPSDVQIEEPRIDYITRNEGHYRMLTWNIDVVPPEQLQPMLYLPPKK